MANPIEVKLIVAAKDTSMISQQFFQGMVNRMVVGAAKYGNLEANRLNNVDMLKSLEQRIEKYKETGNTEWLMDAANYAMMEFMFPKHPNAHYRGTDSRESPGYIASDHSIRKI